MNITMIGAGYVGLVSGACFADFGHSVTCVDLDPDRIDRLNKGEIPIFEPGLDELVDVNRSAGRLRFTTEMKQAVADADVVFIAVGTPSRRGDGHADLSYVHSAARSIAEHVRGYTVVVNKSTVPVGTADAVEQILKDTNPSAEVDVVSNPEFLREGAAIDDFRRPDRIIVGVESEPAKKVMSAVYGPLNLNQSPILFMSRRTAELTKYAANAFLAMKVTFINEMADLAEAVDADVQELARGMGLDNRIGPKFLHPGPGYGGSCFPKDTMALAKTAQEHNRPVRLVETTIALNDERKRAMAQRIVAACGGSVAGRTIGVLGLTFKANTDDMREAPSLNIIPAVVEMGANIRAFDPQGMDAARSLLPDTVVYTRSSYEAAEGADALVILTEWNAFRALDLARIGSAMTQRVLVDLRNVYSPAQAAAHGFAYHCVGQRSRAQS